MKAEKYAIINTIKPEELKQIRKEFDLSQSEFAKLVGVSKPTIERWESVEEKIKGPIAVLVNMLSENPAYLKSRIVPEKQMPLRLFYMHKNRVSPKQESHGEKLVFRRFLRKSGEKALFQRCTEIGGILPFRQQAEFLRADGAE